MNLDSLPRDENATAAASPCDHQFVQDMHDSQPNIHDVESQLESQEIDEIDANKLICRNEENDFQDLEEIDEFDDNGHTLDDVGVQPLDVHPPEGIPHVGMQFSTSEEAYDYYNLFAKRKGFGVRIYSSARGNDGEFRRRCFVCNKEGFKSLKDRREAGRDVKRRKREEREGCKARLVINKSKERIWKITIFDDKHNHELLNTPTKISTLRSHNKAHLHPTCKSLVDRFHSCGVGPSKIARIINSTSGDTSMIITPKQVREHIRVKRKNSIRMKRKNNISHECMNVIQKFVQRQVKNDQFYYNIEINEEGICRSIFWADGKARTSYMQFSDAVVFDVTYKTNNFLLPFAPFTGVNHHNQSTLFGCALLADECEETFVWLFENWLNCMWGKAPGAIITDQDPAIRNAIRRVFPNTRHRYCIWHITLHEDEQLRPLRSSYNPSFDEDYKRWVKKIQTIEEAESCWLLLKEKYKKEFEEPLNQKQKNEMKAWKWLESMYNQRNHWIEAYLKDTFFADMHSSQRSESMNSFFDNYVHSMTPLHEFVEQYDQALASRRMSEEREDTICLRMKLDFQSMHDIEASVAKVYTRKIFEKFQEEFRKGLLCHHKKVGLEGGFKIYNVSSKATGYVSIHTVRYNTSDEIFLCSCSKFETVGILCKHILYIMKQKLDLKSIPTRYILPRWTLNSRHCSTSLGGSSMVLVANGEKINPLESWNLRSSLNKMAEQALKNRALYEVALKCVEDFREQYELLKEDHKFY